MSGAAAGELVRIVQVRALPTAPVRIEAEGAERERLAARFGIVAVHGLEATISLEAEGEAVRATGRLQATIEQGCAVSGEPFRSEVDEPIELRFIRSGGKDAPARFDEEVELDAEELDEIAFDGDSFDLGEAVAQTLGLAIDPYAQGPDAEAARAMAGIVADDAPQGPLAAALAQLKLN